MRFPEFKNKAVTLSYDDGVIYDKRLIEIMDKNGLKGTFNINSGLFSDDGNRRMTREQALELYMNSGHEVAVHGRVHMSLTNENPVSAYNDVFEDRIALEAMFDTIITGMAYAYGDYNDQVVEILKKCGIEYSRTCITTERFDIPTDWLRLPTTCHHYNPKLMKLAKEFLEDSDEPELFYLWGHSYEFNDNNNWNIIEQFSEFVGNRNDVWYATNSEIYRYVKAFDSLKYSVNGQMIYNPSELNVYINYEGKPICVPSGYTIKL